MSNPALKNSGQSNSASYKEVRFSHPLVSVRRRARSVASSNPGLAAQNAPKEKTYSEYSIYIDQSRSLLESQRLNFERERLLFAEERKLWDAERALLKSRIADLESALRNENAQSNTSYFQSDYNLQSSSTSSGLWQLSGPSSTNNGLGQRHVWEGPIPGSRRPTRVFPAEDSSERGQKLYIAPTEANGFGHRTSLDAALSPQLFDRSAEISMPVPIEKVDSQLDGITLKSTALPPGVVAKVMTPPTSLSPTSSPPKDEPESSPPKPAPDAKPYSPLKLNLSDLAKPQENLTRDAGHTPMAILGTDTAVSRQSPINDKAFDEADTEEENDDYEQEGPLAPVVTKQPVENADSYFPAVDEDPALTGPLTLENNEKSDTSFLSQLDQKLLEEAKKAVLGGASSTEGAEDAAAEGAENEPEPELKLKASSNFGTAFGQC